MKCLLSLNVKGTPNSNRNIYRKNKPIEKQKNKNNDIFMHGSKQKNKQTTIDITYYKRQHYWIIPHSIAPFEWIKDKRKRKGKWKREKEKGKGEKKERERERQRENKINGNQKTFNVLFSAYTRTHDNDKNLEIIKWVHFKCFLVFYCWYWYRGCSFINIVVSRNNIWYAMGYEKLLFCFILLLFAVKMVF